jgi:hypothetical protein
LTAGFCAGGVIPFLASSGFAQPAAYEVLSNGMDSCGEYLTGSPQHRQLDLAWRVGFIGGVNSRGALSDSSLVKVIVMARRQILPNSCA